MDVILNVGNVNVYLNQVLSYLNEVIGYQTPVKFNLHSLTRAVKGKML